MSPRTRSVAVAVSAITGTPGKMFAQRGKLAVFRAEIVAPFADAMRFVNREQIHVPLFQIVEKPGQHQPFRRDVKQPEFAVVQAAQARTRFAGGERGIQKRRRRRRRPAARPPGLSSAR